MNAQVEQDKIRDRFVGVAGRFLQALDAGELSEEYPVREDICRRVLEADEGRVDLLDKLAAAMSGARMKGDSIEEAARPHQDALDALDERIGKAAEELAGLKKGADDDEE